MLSLHHIGERLVVELLLRAQERGNLHQLTCLRHGDSCTFESVFRRAGLEIPMQFQSEVPLAAIKHRIFDGSHKVDCLALDSVLHHPAIAMEVKLGQTGLAKATVDAWLGNCDWSNHPTRRISGTMMAFLEGHRPPKRDHEPDLTAEPICAQVTTERTRTVFTEWWLVIRHRHWRGWLSGEEMPHFSNRAHILSIEALIEKSGEKGGFDSFIYQLLATNGGTNFFARWGLD